MIVLPAMPAEQTASWLGILDLYDRLNEGWTLIGGQLVHLHCAERGEFPVRPTNDADTVIDVRHHAPACRSRTSAASRTVDDVLTRVLCEHRDVGGHRHTIGERTGGARMVSYLDWWVRLSSGGWTQAWEVDQAAERLAACAQVIR